MLCAKTQDRRPASTPRILDDSRYVSQGPLQDERNIRYILQNAKLLEELQLSVGSSFVGLLSLTAHTLKILDLSVPFHNKSVPLRLPELCEELEAMAGRNALDVLSFVFQIVGDETEFHRIYNPRSGEGTGRIWVVCVKAGIFSSLL